MCTGRRAEKGTRTDTHSAHTNTLVCRVWPLIVASAVKPINQLRSILLAFTMFNESESVDVFSFVWTFGHDDVAVPHHLLHPEVTHITLIQERTHGCGSMRYHFAFGILFCVSAFAVAFSGGSPVAAVGGGVNNGSPSSLCDAGSETDIINDFLSDSQVQDSAALEKFHVHGWRWHTLSLRREAKRLQELAERRQSEKGSHDKSSSLKQAADYVIGFNLKG